MKSVYFCFFIFLALLGVIGGKKVVREKVRSTSDSTITGDDRMTVGSGSTGNAHTLEIQHAIGQDGIFHTRGYVQINNLKSHSSPVSFDQEKLTAEDLKQLEEAAISNDYYYMRAKRNVSDDATVWSDNEDIILTVMSACALMKSSLKDRIYIHGDGQGSLISLSIMTSESVLDTELNCDNVMFHKPQHFTTKVQYTTSKTGSVPQVQGFLQKQETEKAKKETEDNRSFFQKYWLYLVIGFVAFQFLLSAGGGGGGGGGS